MKEGFRQSMAWLHTWVGLVVGWVLFFVFLTGTTAYFDTEIDRWMQPERPLRGAQTNTEQAIDAALARLQRQAPEAEQWTIQPPQGREPDLRISWRIAAPAGERASNVTEVLDEISGAPVQWRDTGGGQLLYKMHYRLHYVKQRTGYWTVGLCTMFMLVAILTGIVTHKRIFKDFFTFRPRKGQRSWLDAHALVSVTALPFHLMITYSGLVFYMTVFMPLIVSATYGFGDDNRRAFRSQPPSIAQQIDAAGVHAPLAPLQPMLAIAKQQWGGSEIRSINIRHPGDANARVAIARSRTNTQSGSDQMIFDGVSGALLDPRGPQRSTPRQVHDTLLGLHEGLFAGTVLRWLYFLSGVLGTAMVGTGLVLWTVKRRTQAAAGRHVKGLQLVERLNVGTILGLPSAIAVYFWANRLIPVDLPGRAPWEAHAMFISWALILLYCARRPIAQAWRELAVLAAMLCALLPVVNWLTTERHLGVTLPRSGYAGDWALAGFDLAVLAFGVCFAALAAHLARRERTKTQCEMPTSGELAIES